MCGTCGCGEPDELSKKEGHHHHDHEHDHAHSHTHTVTLEQSILARNETIAEENRQLWATSGTLVLNLMSSPGAGKTTILERTITDLGKEFNWVVIEGDQQTDLDARRLENLADRTIQINTGTGCHLDADMVRRALADNPNSDRTILAIENVGNLVCPAMFDLGETWRVVIISTTEGIDKPLKYPHMFRAADLCIINKLDLAPYLDFDLDQLISYARQINPDLTFFPMSATTGESLAPWYDWLRQEQVQAASRANVPPVLQED